MDDQRFDDLVRSLFSGPAPRRAGLRLLAGGALGLLGLGAPARSGAHDPLSRCKKIGDKKKRQKCIKKGKAHRRSHADPGPVCTPDCASSACGDDGCGGSCGSCEAQPATSCGTTGECAGGDCALYGTQTVCRPASCGPSSFMQSVLVREARCDGKGACPPSTSADCAPYRCDSGGCRTSCGGDAHCVGGAWCWNSVCRFKQPNGTSCSIANQCLSGHCVGGVCCDSACPAVANATNTCAGGTCAYACLAGFGDCDGDLSNGCETDLAWDPRHCGGCNNLCGGTCAKGAGFYECQDGSCVCTQ